MGQLWPAVTTATALLALAQPASAAPVLDEAGGLELSQAAIGKTLGNHVFRDTGRRAVDLAELRGRPLVLNLVYTGCSQACPLIVQNLYPAVEVAQDALGEDAFTVVTVGFDSRNDTPDRMRAFARSQGVDLPNWLFLSADQSTIERLTREVGFSVFPSSQGFDHLAQVSIVDRDGRVYRQIYGGAFEPPALVEPLKDLVFGRQSQLGAIQNLVNRVKLFCTLYDARSGRYRFDWSVFVGIAIGVVSLSAVAFFLVREWRRAERHRPGV